MENDDDWSDSEEIQEEDPSIAARMLAPKFSWLDQSEDVWISVMQFLDGNSRKSVSFVCKDLKRASERFYGDWSLKPQSYSNPKPTLIGLLRAQHGVMSIKDVSFILGGAIKLSEFLEILKNQFEKMNVLPENAFPRLQKLDLSECHGMTIPFLDTLLQYCTQIRELDISNCSGIWGNWKQQHEVLAKSFARLPNLRVLKASASLGQRKVQFVEGGAADSMHRLIAILAPIAPRLEELRLSNCNIKDKRLKILLEGVSFPNLKVLYLRNSWCLTDESAELLCKVFGTNPVVIKHISLRNSQITPKGVEMLRRVLVGAEIDLGIQARPEALTIQTMLLKRFQ